MVGGVRRSDCPVGGDHVRRRITNTLSEPAQVGHARVHSPYRDGARVARLGSENSRAVNTSTSFPTSSLASPSEQRRRLNAVRPVQWYDQVLSYVLANGSLASSPCRTHVWVLSALEYILSGPGRHEAWYGSGWRRCASVGTRRSSSGPTGAASRRGTSDVAMRCRICNRFVERVCRPKSGR